MHLEEWSKEVVRQTLIPKKMQMLPEWYGDIICQLAGCPFIRRTLVHTAFNAVKSPTLSDADRIKLFTQGKKQESIMIKPTVKLLMSHLQASSPDQEEEPDEKTSDSPEEREKKCIEMLTEYFKHNGSKTALEHAEDFLEFQPQFTNSQLSRQRILNLNKVQVTDLILQVFEHKGPTSHKFKGADKATDNLRKELNKNIKVEAVVVSYVRNDQDE